MVTNTVKDGKLYHLIWDEFAEFLINKTSYNVYFLSYNTPLLKVNKDNFKAFKKLNEEGKGYTGNNFILEIELPSLKITSDQYKGRIKIDSSYDGFQGLCFDSPDEWQSKEIDRIYIEKTKPLHEARKRGENPEWITDQDWNDIKVIVILHLINTP